MLMENDNQSRNNGRRSRESNKLTNMGKIPPQAIDLEESVLGALLLERNAIYDVVDMLKPEMFYRDAHQLIYKAISKLYHERNPIDIRTVTAKLRSEGTLELVGGAYAITELTNGVASSANIEYWSRIVMQKYLSREIIRINSEMINQGYDDTSDPFDLLGQLTKFLADAELGFIGSNERDIASIATEVMKIRETAKENDNSIHGLKSGITELDKLLDGFLPGELDVIAARPAMGKTAVICAIAKYNTIDEKNPLVIFSLEMGNKSLFLRLESNTSGIKGNDIRRNNLTDQEREILSEVDGLLSNGDLIIDDTSFININQIVRRIRMYVRKYGIKVVLIDYLQLIQGDNAKGGNREAEISYMTRCLKVLAQELGIPIIILAQLSREVEKRKPLCLPQLSDLRESGAIEQDADKVIFLWRPEYYNVTEPTQFRLFNKTIDNKNLLVFIVAKHREGELGNIPARFTPWNMRVLNHPDLEDQASIDFTQPATNNMFNIKPNGAKPTITGNEEDPPF